MTGAALVFDLGGVIVGHDSSGMFNRLASRCRERTAASTVRTHVQEGGWSTGASIEGLHAQLQTELGYSGDWNQFVEDWNSHFALDEDMLSFVERLSLTGRVLLFSNTNKQHWDHVVGASAGRLNAFERYLSYELGQAKPSVAAFRAVAEQARVDPAKSIFIDDAPVNAEGARAAGFQVELFRGRRVLQLALRKRGFGVG